MIFSVTAGLEGVLPTRDYEDDPLIKSIKDYCGMNNIDARLHLGNGLAFEPEDWPDEAGEKTIDIVFFGSNNITHVRNIEYFPGIYNGDPINIPVRDTIVESSRSDTFCLKTDQGFYYGEVTGNPRILYFAMNPWMLREADQLVNEKFIDGIRKAFEWDYTPDMSGLIDDLSNYLEQSRDNQIENIKQSLIEGEAQISAYQRRIASQIGAMRETTSELRVIESTDIDVANISSQLDSIVNHPMIITTSVDTYVVEDDVVIALDTVHLDIHDEEYGGEIPLGKFRLEIRPYSNRVQIHNITNPRQERDHPHVSGGDPCFAGYQTEFDSYMQAGQYTALVEFLLGYLQTYNPDDDWGRFINYWR